MARKPRFGLAGVPQHVIQRGNNRGPCFFADADCQLYHDCIRDAGERYRCSVHAYVFMTNQVHLLVTPKSGAPELKRWASIQHHRVSYGN